MNRMNKQDFCPNCSIGLNSREMELGFCQNCKHIFTGQCAFECCDECDMSDACEDFGCAIKTGLHKEKMNIGEIKLVYGIGESPVGYTMKKVKQPNVKIRGSYFFIRSLTNDKELAKQYFAYAYADNYSDALIVRKIVLSKNKKLYKDYKPIKQFKNYYLFEQIFSIKVDTLKIVMSVLNLK